MACKNIKRYNPIVYESITSNFVSVEIRNKGAKMDITEQDKLPGSITYFNRDWLYPLRKVNSGYFSTVIDAEEIRYTYARLEISSGYDSMTLSFDLTDDIDYKDGLAALYKLRDAIHLLAKEVVEQREAAIARAKKFDIEAD